MSDQDELRDRIMEPIWQNTMLTTEGAKRVAQAIIDELHLFAEVDEDWGAMVIEGWWEKQ